MSDKCKICGKQVQYLPAHLKRHNTTIVKYGQRCPEWICFRNALIDSRMTPNQLWEAIQLNLVRSKNEPNSDNTETASALVFTEDIAKNYKRIKQLPKFSAEELERRRKIYLNRKREEMGRHLSFYCPRCRENVTSLLDSLILQSALRGKMTPEEGCENFKLSHYRHIHTDYESELFSVEEKVQDYYSEELCPKYDYDRCQVMLEAFQKSIKYTKQKAKIKARCNKKAKRLIREDFSQKMDEEQEEHSGRIKNFQSP